MDKELLEILACPVCRESVDMKDGMLLCAGCSRQYPIRGGIPVLLPEEAQVASEDRSET